MFRSKTIRTLIVLFVTGMILSQSLTFADDGFEVWPMSIGSSDQQAHLTISNGSGHLYVNLQLKPGYRADVSASLQFLSGNGTWIDLYQVNQSGSSPQLTVNQWYPLNQTGTFQIRCVAFIYLGGSYVERLVFYSNQVSQ